MPVADARLPDETLQGSVVRCKCGPRSPGAETQTIPRRGNFARNSICIKDMARERNQHAAMPPLIDQIEGAIADKAQRAEPKLGLHGPLEMRRQQSHEPQHLGGCKRLRAPGMTHDEGADAIGAVQKVDEDGVANLVGMRPVIEEFAATLAFRRNRAGGYNHADVGLFHSGRDRVEPPVVPVVLPTLHRIEIGRNVHSPTPSPATEDVQAPGIASSRENNAFQRLLPKRRIERRIVNILNEFGKLVQGCHRPSPKVERGKVATRAKITRLVCSYEDISPESCSNAHNLRKEGRQLWD